MNRVLTVGGGPAGLYASLLLKKLRPGLDVTVIEKNPRGATYGWGVVFSDRTLAEFREADQRTFEQITDRFVLWDAIDINYRGEVVRSGGHVFAGLARVALLDILTTRCEELGVELRFEEEMTDAAALGEHDLVIASDGVHSPIREHFEKAFRPRIELGGARYIWFGTERVLDSFRFAFRENDHGFFQAHAYPFDGTTSTWIVETDEETWRRAGLDASSEAESIAYCQRLFAEELRGHGLMSNKSEWIQFPTLRNRTWIHDNIGLVGDAAHTAHFSIGSGTKLAMEDAIALVRAIERFPEDLGHALTDYEMERRPVIERFQEAAHESRSYFENTRRYKHLEPMPFAFHLLTRSKRIDYGNLRTRDPVYVDEVDSDFAGGDRVSPPPMLVPFRLRGLELLNRVASAPSPEYASREGLPSEQLLEGIDRAAEGGSALIVTEPVAVTQEGRITPGCAGLYSAEHDDAWRGAAQRAHGSGAALAIRLSHAGRRGATRPRDRGTDRPLGSEAWPLLAPSPVPYSSRSAIPEEMTGTDLTQVRDAFVAAARRAASADVDMLLIHMGHGYLLGSFLSLVADARGDEYGGEHESRIRYPLEVFEAVREAWPEDMPLGATIQASDAAAGGWTEEDAVVLAGELARRGCDLIEPVVGQMAPESRPRYGPGFLVSFADRIRNECDVPTLVGGGITNTVQVNTILAAASADLCILTG
ncbi:MAG: FAD-dependent monooxygenase [Actinomycetota bacterium]